MTTALARADVARMQQSPYRSQAEAQFAAFGMEWVSDHLNIHAHVMLYEPLSVNLPGGRYTPDFLIIGFDGLMYFIEVKGSRKQAGYRDARSKLRAAAAICRWARWFEVIVGGREWSIEEMERSAR